MMAMRWLCDDYIRTIHVSCTILQYDKDGDVQNDRREFLFFTLIRNEGINNTKENESFVL